MIINKQNSNDLQSKGNTERLTQIVNILEQAQKDGRKNLLEHEAKSILDYSGIKTTPCHLATNVNDAVTASKDFGFPVVLKVASQEIIHKSDSGGVQLSLEYADQVETAYKNIESNFAGYSFLGVNVQPMMPTGIEAILGISRDQCFGPVLMFGLGGVFVEILKDVTFRVLPITEQEALEMIKDIKGVSLLEGFRGSYGDIQSLIDLMLKISVLVENYPEIEEIDLNPVFIYPSGYCIVDARIVLTCQQSVHCSSQKVDIFSGSDFSQLFYPKSIAVIGATNNPDKLGYNVISNLIGHNFSGKIYPVNPNESNIQGLPAYAKVQEIPDTPDVAIILIPAKKTVNAVLECSQKDIPFLVVESAGFAEIGQQGQQDQELLLDTIHEKKIRILGPNCTGIINTHHQMVQTIGALGELGKGNVGLIAQAGVYAAGILTGLRHVIDFGIIATIGNKVDINEVDILKFMGQDDHIQVIALYMEDMRHGRQFLFTAKQISREKPIIVLKTGRTQAGQKVASSHTASLAGDERINDALFKQSGIIRAKDNDHMFNLIRAFSKQPLPQNNAVYIITYTGSLGVAAADVLDAYGMSLSCLEPAGQRKIQELLPDYISNINPLDLAFTMNSEQLKNALNICMQSNEVGSCLVILQGETLDTYLDLFQEIDHKKPIICCVACKEFMMDKVIAIEKLGYPVFSTPEMASEVLATMYQYARQE